MKTDLRFLEWQTFASTSDSTGKVSFPFSTTSKVFAWSRASFILVSSGFYSKKFIFYVHRSRRMELREVLATVNAVFALYVYLSVTYIYFPTRSLDTILYEKCMWYLVHIVHNVTVWIDGQTLRSCYTRNVFKIQTFHLWERSKAISYSDFVTLQLFFRQVMSSKLNCFIVK